MPANFNLMFFPFECKISLFSAPIFSPKTRATDVHLARDTCTLLLHALLVLLVASLAQHSLLNILFHLYGSFSFNKCNVCTRIIINVVCIAARRAWGHRPSVLQLGVPRSLHHWRCPLVDGHGIRHRILGLSIALGAAIQQDMGLRAVNGVMDLQALGGESASWRRATGGAMRCSEA